MLLPISQNCRWSQTALIKISKNHEAINNNPENLKELSMSVEFSIPILESFHRVSIIFLSFHH